MYARPGNSHGPNPTAHLAGVGEENEPCCFQQGQAPSSVQGRPRRHPRRRHRCRRRRPADGRRLRLRRLRRDLGRRRPVRVRRQLVHQHRQRLLRRPAVLALHLGRAGGTQYAAARRPGHQGPADSRRREGPRHPGPGCLACAAASACPTPVARLPRHSAPPATGPAEQHRASRPRSPPRAAPKRPAAKKTVTTPTGKKVQKGDGEYKVVKAGDTLAKIAEAHKVKGGWEKLFKLNKRHRRRRRPDLPGPAAPPD